jgi:hypothetical protein
MWNLTSFRLDTVLVLVQDRCTVYAKRTISSEIVLDAPDGTPRWQGSSEGLVRLEIVLILVQKTICVERTIGSESVWTHPMELLGDEAQGKARFGPFEDSANLDAR